ncbi:MAG: Mur ligase family protein [Chloroflexota bacterium]
MNNDSNISGITQTIADYHQAQRWLLSLITDPTGARYHKEKSKAQRQQEFEEQLQRTDNFLNYVDNPHTKYASIHVAGTSGKGSVVVMLAAILRAANINMGYHISPYLQVCNEKLIVGDKMISPSEFTQLVNDFKEQYTQWVRSNKTYPALKYGEAWVALTYYWLARREVDWAVIETGLGGRYDPTNVLPADVAVITNVDFDHVYSLGPELDQIAHHKAGIIKPEAIVITGEKNPQILKIIQQEVVAKYAKLFRLDQEFNFSVEKTLEGNHKISVNTQHNTYENITLPMKGQFQPTNAALAIATIDQLAVQGRLAASEKNIQQAFENLSFPGRMEMINSEPTVILDGAHNPHKIQGLADSLKHLYPGKKFNFVFGVLSTKNATGMLEILSPLSSSWKITQPHVFGKPAWPAIEIARILENIDAQSQIKIFEQVGQAIMVAMNEVDVETIIVVTGSLYLVGEARNVWFPTNKILRSLEENN